MAGFLSGENSVAESWVRPVGTGVAARLPERLQGVSGSAARPPRAWRPRGPRESRGIEWVSEWGAVCLHACSWGASLLSAPPPRALSRKNRFAEVVQSRPPAAEGL